MSEKAKKESGAGKGDSPRKVNLGKYQDNYSKINWGKHKEDKKA